MFQGCGTALETPLLGARLDEDHFQVLVREQVEAGVDFIVAGLPSAAERLPATDMRKAIEIAVRETRGKVRVLASTWGRLTSAVIACVRECEALGADGVLCPPPPSGASQTLVRDHFEVLASSSSMPIVIDNMAPGITPVALPVIVHLANNPRIIGVREYGARVEEILGLIQRLPDGFTILSGTDSNAVALIAMGGSGVISAAANRIPGKVARMIGMSIKGNFADACRLQKQCRSQLLQADRRWTDSTPEL